MPKIARSRAQACGGQATPITLNVNDKGTYAVHLHNYLLRGFTLIELMIVIVVVAILAAVGIPAYTNQIEKSRRADAISSILDTAQRLERCFTRNLSYADCINPNQFDSPDGFYRITVNAAPTSYDIIARGQNRQASDPCSPYELDSLGNREAGSTSDRCWGSR
jgi:type IV pilus assembly protein PilE